MGRPYRVEGGGGDGRPVQPAAAVTATHAGAGGAEGAASAGEAPVGTGADRWPVRAGGVDVSCGAAPGRSRPPGPPGPGHGPAGTPLRASRARRPGPRRHQEAGQHPDGGGWRTQGRRQGKLNRTATKGHTTDRWGGARLGYSYLHTAIDDHSRLAYTEILDDERKDTAAAFWRRAQAWFAAHGITVRRVIADNGSCYKSFLWRDTLHELGIAVKKTRPFRPQTNGKVERFHRTLTEEWAYARPYPSESARRAALPAWLHAYNHHRAHTALGGHPPASRVPNLSGQNT